jgi:xanthine dehydrogenase small subunit
MNTELVTVEFLLNGIFYAVKVDPKISTLNLLKEEFHLMGTKEGCGEGDCGACTVALGSLNQGHIEFCAIASCIYPAVKLHGKHLITIEGLGDHSHLHVIQQHIINSYGVQCGFCSPGIIMSFFALFAMNTHPSMQEIEIALQGNICRCTGYEGIRKAGETLITTFETDQNAALSKEIVPSYVFETIDDLKRIQESQGGKGYHVPYTLQEYQKLIASDRSEILISGGTDVEVQIKQRKIPKDASLIDISRIKELQSVEEHDGVLYFGSQLSIAACVRHPLVQKYFPTFAHVAHLMASTQIRNVATIAGNIANASPIGDTTVFFLALDASIGILRSKSANIERLPLRSFFIDYRKTELKQGDLIVDIGVPIHKEDNLTQLVHFEKTSRRKDVDIATVNSASVVYMRESMIVKWDIAFGGVGPIPFAVENITDGKEIAITLDEDLLERIGASLLKRCSTLDDVRGSGAYRNQLVKNHVIKHFIAHTNSMNQEV